MKNSKKSPPVLGKKILQSITPSFEAEALLGDFEEIFKDLSIRRGRSIALLWYWTQIILLFPSSIKDSIYWSKEMIKNYLKVVLRNIKKSKTYSFVNILGLAIGMACCFLILLYVQHEFSYDRFHEKSDQIYRITTEWRVEGQAQIHQTTAAPVAPALMNDFPEVQDAVRVKRTGAIIYHKDRSFVERRVYLVDPSFFDIFNFLLIRGDPKTALGNPHSIVLTEKSAEKYFGREDPIGKILTFGKRFDFEITGIAKDAPPNSHLNFDFLVRFDFINEYTSFNYLGSWGAWNFYTYVLLQKGFSLSDFEEKTAAFIKKYRGEDSTNPQRFHLQTLTKINLETHGKLKYIYFFSAIAIIILILVCINFMNLSVARSSTRVREIGIRKVLGATVSNIIILLIRECSKLVLLANIVAWPIAYYVMNKWLQNFAYRMDVGLWLFVLSALLALSIAILTIGYHAVKAALANPVDSLRYE